MVVDRDHRVVAANRRFAEAFGFIGPHVIGSLCHLTLACPELDQSGHPGGCAACDVTRLKQPRKLLRSLPDESGVMRRWETTLSPVLDGGGEITHVVEVWRDITDRSQLESQLSHSERLASLGIHSVLTFDISRSTLADPQAGHGGLGFSDIERYSSKRSLQESHRYS